MNSASAVLLTNASATGSWVAWPGGRGVFSVDGTFGGASVYLNYRSPDGTSGLRVQVLAQDGKLTAVALTAEGGYLADLPPGQVRAEVSGGTPSALYARLDRVPV